MQKDIQRIRNLTTGIVHTKMEDVYDDLEIIMGTKGLDPHRLPQALSAVKPWLREHIANIYFWDGKYDPVHRGEITLPEPTDKERKLMLDLYNASPDPQINKSMKLYNVLVTDAQRKDLNNKNEKVTAGRDSTGSDLLGAYVEVPIDAAKRIAEEYNKNQVIIICWDQKHGRTHVTTYGKTKKECEQAAIGGKKIKRALGWPDHLCNAKLI